MPKRVLPKALRPGFVCVFSGGNYDALKGRAKADYETVKAAVIADGRFSAFDASATATSARLFDRLERDPAVECVRDTPYPWITVHLRTAQPQILPVSESDVEGS